MKRTDFLKKTALAAFGISLTSQVSYAENGFVGDCETSSDILGPYYREKAPERSSLLFEGIKGIPISIKGRVYSSDCQTLIPNATVEIWHCSSEGEYDNDSSEFRHRASAKTDAQAQYLFETILPGKYLNGKEFRPSHIHFRLRAEGHKELVSQIYFSGDPHIAKDPWASHKKAEHRILPIAPENTTGGLSVIFDIYLKKH